MNHSVVDPSLIWSSEQMQRDLDYFMNDLIRKKSQEAIKSIDPSATIPEVPNENNHDWANRFDCLTKVQ